LVREVLYQVSVKNCMMRKRKECPCLGFTDTGPLCEIWSKRLL
jgi:hypothetical protein